MKKFFKELFTDNYNRPDPHKVVGVLYFIMAGVYLFAFRPDYTILGILVGASTASFSVGAVNDKPTLPGQQAGGK